MSGSGLLKWATPLFLLLRRGFMLLKKNSTGLSGIAGLFYRAEANIFLKCEN